MRGHEAAVLGSVYALRATDWMVPYYREWPAYMWRGWPLENLILYYAGYAEGMRVPDGVRDLPLCIPIASQVPHAVGLAYASRSKGEDSVTLVYFGDGASSHGDCQEAMNFAGVFQAPLIFFCLNNQWAISLPSRPRPDARPEGDRHGFQGSGGRRPAGLLRDAQTVVRARRGEGHLVEALTYRLSLHHRGRPKYRERPRSRRGRPRPFPGFGALLETKGVLDATVGGSKPRWTPRSGAVETPRRRCRRTFSTGSTTSGDQMGSRSARLGTARRDR
jgi:pyruvate dehydrogenase E1 component alpha subunit